LEAATITPSTCEEVTMPTYLVERYLPGMTPELMAAAARNARQAAERISTGGTAVRYLQSTYLPQDETCFCLFEASSAVAVAAANEAARMPFERIVEALHVRVDEPPRAGQPDPAGPPHGRGQPPRVPDHTERAGGPPCQ
jgi:Protein of unknown function (DUF4242)